MVCQMLLQIFDIFNRENLSFIISYGIQQNAVEWFLLDVSIPVLVEFFK